MDSILTTIEGSFAIGLLIGLLVGVIAPNLKIGCIGVFLVPVGMVLYIDNWQSRHPEALTSTSGLDFLFGPVMPTLGCVLGFCIIYIVKSWPRK